MTSSHEPPFPCVDSPEYQFPYYYFFILCEWFHASCSASYALTVRSPHVPPIAGQMYDLGVLDYPINQAEGPRG
jgi:hypothetical protein